MARFERAAPVPLVVTEREFVASIEPELAKLPADIVPCDVKILLPVPVPALSVTAPDVVRPKVLSVIIFAFAFDPAILTAPTAEKVSVPSFIEAVLFTVSVDALDTVAVPVIVCDPDRVIEPLPLVVSILAVDAATTDVVSRIKPPFAPLASRNWKMPPCAFTAPAIVPVFAPVIFTVTLLKGCAAVPKLLALSANSVPVELRPSVLPPGLLPLSNLPLAVRVPVADTLALLLTISPLLD